MSSLLEIISGIFLEKQLISGNFFEFGKNQKLISGFNFGKILEIFTNLEKNQKLISGINFGKWKRFRVFKYEAL